MTEQRLETEELVARRVVAQGLYLVDANGLARASVQLEGSQAAQTLYDDQGRVRVRLGLTEQGSPTLTLCDDKEVIRAQVYLKPSGEPRIGMADASGKLRIKIYMDDGGEPTIALAAQDGKPRTELTIVAEKGELKLRDDDGTVPPGA